MSGELIDRLRNAKGSERYGPLDDGSYSLAPLDNVELCNEAADEIENLRSMLAICECPICDGSGVYIIHEYQREEPTLAQCEWCHRRAAMPAPSEGPF